MATVENNNTSSRQAARRRRIIERGNDRLALITGRIQSLPPPTQSDQFPSATCPPSDISNHEDERSTPLSHNDPICEISEESLRPGPVIPECETGEEVPKVPLLNFDIQEQPSQLSSTSLDTNESTHEHHLEPTTRRFEFCTSKEISSALKSTELTRLYCALAAAIIIVFSYVGFPILGNYFLKGVILFRPLFLLILTNISIVAQHIMSEKQRGSSRAGRGRSDIPSGSGLNRLGDVLEIGLLLKNVIESLFMDCSIFSAVVICGISIAKTLGW